MKNVGQILSLYNIWMWMLCISYRVEPIPKLCCLCFRNWFWMRFDECWVLIRNRSRPLLVIRGLIPMVLKTLKNQFWYIIGPNIHWLFLYGIWNNQDQAFFDFVFFKDSELTDLDYEIFLKFQNRWFSINPNFCTKLVLTTCQNLCLHIYI
jgi:hypothetical protein